MNLLNNRLKNIEEYKPSSRSDDPNISKLDWNECNIPITEELKNVIKTSLDEISFSEYPHIHNEELLQELSKYCNINSDYLQIFNGSDSALHYIFATFLNSNTKVLIFYPNYNQIETYIKLYSEHVVYSKIIEPFTNHTYNFDDIQNVDVIYISNPNNPTGVCLNPKIIENLLNKFPEKLFLVDEAYFEFSKLSCINLTKIYDNIIITRTFSKAFSLASIRLGYLISSPKNIININKIRNTKEVNSFAQKIGTNILKNFHLIQFRIDEIIENRIFFENELRENQIEFINSDSNFVLIRSKNHKVLIDEFKKNNILVRDRSMFESLENSIRISIGTLEEMKKIIDIIKKTKNESR